MMGRRRIMWTFLLIAAAISLTGAGTYSVFTSTVSNTGNSFAAGTVAIGDNDAGSAMLTAFTSAKPGDVDTSCIKVTTTGSLSSSVRLYGSTTGGLAPYLTLTVTRGTNISPFDDCTNFIADLTDYNGNGSGVIYTGLLSAFPTTYGTGVVDPKAATPESWATSESHDYKFSVTLNNDSAAQSQSSTATFTWEAQNE